MYGEFCIECPLRGKEQPQNGKGNKTAKYMVVTDSPSHRESDFGRLISQSGMKIFAEGMIKQGFNKQDFYFYPSVRCPFDPDKYTGKEKTKIGNCCRQYLLKEIRTVKPEAIIPLGAEPSRRVLGHAVKVTKVRGLCTTTDEISTPIFPMLNPLQVHLYPQHKPIFDADCVSFSRLVDHNFDIQKASENVFGEYSFIDDLEFLVKKKPKIIAYDTENTSLRWYAPNAKLLTMQFCIEPGVAYLLPWDHPDNPQSQRSKARLKKQFQQLMCRDEIKVVNQNTKYDCVYTCAQTGIRFRIGGDTLMLATLLDENSIARNLGDLTKRYVPELSGYHEFFESKADKTNMAGEPLDESFLLYACLSGDSLIQLGDCSWKKIKDLVKDRYSGLVKSFDGKNIVQSRVIDWHRYDTLKEQKWYKIRTVSTESGRWGFIGPAFTNDHKIYTVRGDVCVKDLIIGKDRILTSEKQLSKDGISVLLGSLLGDGGFINKNDNKRGLRIGQSYRRRFYAEWKARHFSVLGKYSVYESEDAVRYNIPFTKYLAEMERKFSRHDQNSHRHRKLKITSDVLENLGILGLAIWYQDDGTLVMGKDGYVSSRIYCTKLKYEETVLVIKWLSQLISAEVTYNYNSGFIQIGAFSIVQFHKLILPYMHPACAYKSIYPKLVKECLLNFDGGPYYELITAINEYKHLASRKHANSVRWCITVENHHNFVTKVGVVANCGDSDAAFRLNEVLYKEVSKSKKLLANYHHVVIPCLNAFASLELRGMLINEQGVDDFEKVMEEDVANKYRTLLRQVPKSIRRDHIKDGLRFSRAEFLIDILFRHKDGFRLKPKVFTKGTIKLDKNRKVPSVSSKDHLPFFFEECPFTVELAEYIKAERILTANIKGFKKKYIQDGKIRPVYNLHVAVTGRSASDSPNGQNLPNKGKVAKKYNELFVAPEGYVILAADYSQIELRLIAHVANEPLMIDIYKKNGDIHKETALMVLGISAKDFDRLSKEDRYMARFRAKSCIAEGQLVLTDVGLVPIENITEKMLVWDGVEWAKHEGVVYKGYKEVITYENLTATPDHKVYTDRGAVQIGELASAMDNERIVISGNEEVPIRYIENDWRDKKRKAWGKIYRVFLQFLQSILFGSSKQHKKKCYKKLQVSKKAKIFRQQSTNFRRKIRCYATKMCCFGKQIIQKLWRSRYKNKIQFERALYSMDFREFAAQGLSSSTDRSYRQQWALRAWEFTFSKPKNKSYEQEEQQQSVISRTDGLREPFMAFNKGRLSRFFFLYRVHDKISRSIKKWRQSSYAQKVNYEKNKKNRRSKYGNSRDIQTYKNNNKTFAHVYDIVNAGSRHRFTVNNKLVANCNFGFAFNMQYIKFMIYAKTQYQVEFSEEEAIKVREGFFYKYKGLAPWHEHQKEFAHEHGYVESLTGRIRHLPTIYSENDAVVREAERQSINSSIQCVGSELGHMTLGRIEEEVNPEYFQTVGFVHDAVRVYVPEQYTEWGARTLKYYMESNPLEEWFGVKMKVPITAEVAIGRNLAESYELEGLTINDKVGTYDFSQFYDKKEKKGLILPKQLIPPNNGRLPLD